MKVITLKSTKAANEFLANENVQVQSITPFQNERNGVIWAATYLEKVITEKKVYRFGCGSHLGTTWDQHEYILADDEYGIVKKAFIKRELASEPYRFREEILRTEVFEEWE